MASALAFGGCDGMPLPEDSAQGAALTGADLAAKVDPGLAFEVNVEATHTVIALLDEAPLRAALSQAATGLEGHGGVEAYAFGMEATKDRILGRLASQPLRALNRYRNLPALALQVESTEALMALAADPGVVRVVPNVSHSMLETAASLTLINQPRAALAGKLGAGTTVAILDTGADFKRAPFNCLAAGAAGCPIVYAADFAPEDNNVDSHGHGTNVSGIVLSVAPAAKIAALDVFNGESAWTTDILAAINWTIQNKAKYNIVAINMSLGGGLSATACAQDALAVAVASARSAGILSAIASGNSGSTSSISSPACAPDAVSVGAVHAANLGALQWSTCGDTTTAADKVACFSCSSSFLTMLAPGVMVNAAGIVMSGTSQATPHVAGAIAVLRAAFPSESPTSIVTRLTAAGVPVKDARNGITKPRLDLWASLSAAVPAPPAPVTGPTGTIVLNGGAAFTGAALVKAALTVKSGTATKVCLSESSTCSAWVTNAASVAFTLSAGNGNKTLRAWWQDAAGNASASAATASINVDTTAPVDGTLVASAAGLQVALNWSGFSDAGSGISGYRLITASTAVAERCATGVVAYEGALTTFTKLFPAAGTYYVRVCARDAIGNMSPGRAVTVVLAPAVRTATLTATSKTLQAGNTAGGIAYDDACPAGQALVGFAGSVSMPLGSHRQISARCAVVEIVGATVGTRSGAILATRGKPGVSSWIRECPAGQVVVGFAGRAGALIDQLAFGCAPLMVSATTPGSPLVVGARTTLAAVGGSGGLPFAAINCPPGQVAAMARVRVGDNLDAFGLGCSKAVIGP